jgi:hypothetical protein
VTADARSALPGNPASAIYGTIVVASQLAIESASGHRGTGAILGVLAGTLVIFWLAHAYTDTLGEVLVTGGREHPSLRRALRIEWPIVESGALPAVGIAVVVIAGGTPSGAAFAGLVVAAVELVGWALLAGRRADVHGVRLLAYVGGAVLFGALLVLLKFLLH